MKLFTTKTKFINFLVLSIAMFSLLILPFFATTNLTANAAIAPQIVKVGWFQIEGLQEGDSDKTRGGYCYEYLQTLANYANFKYEFVDCSFAEAEKYLENGTIDLIALMRKTPERENLYEFSKNSSGQNYGVVTKNKNDLTQYSLKSTIAIVKDSVWRNDIAAELHEQNIETDVVLFDTNEEAYNALENRKTTFLIHNNFAKLREYEEVVKEVLPERFYFSAKKGNKKLIDSVNLAMEQVIINEPNFEYSLQNKYLYKKSGNIFSLNENDKKIVEKHKKIKLGVNSRSGLGYNIDEKTKKASGIYVDFCNELSKLIGLEIEIVPFEDAAIGSQMFSDGQIDGFVAAQYDYAKANLFNLKITIPYYESKLSVITLSKKSPYTENEKIAYVDRLNFVEEFLEAKFPTSELTQYLNIEEAFTAVKRGKVDALIMPSLLSDYYLFNSSNAMLAQHQIPFEKGVSIGFSSKMDNAFVDIFNKAISSFDDDYFDSLVKLIDINNIHQTTLLSIMYSEPYWTLFFVVFTITLIVAILVMIKFHIYSTQTNDNLEKDNQNKIDFLSHISHELRTPINGLNGMFDLMTPNSVGRSAKNIQNAKNSLIQLNGLINNVLDFLRLEKNKIAIVPTLNTRGEILSRSDAIVNPIAKSKNITINKKIDIAQYSYFYIDKFRASQIISNISIVAIELCKSNSVLESNFKVIEKDENKKYISYEIFGDKIDMSILDVFKFNFKSTKDAGIDTDDINLRLILSKKLAKMMGGKLMVSKKKGVV
ncbi:MAG: transporter substrate-binding domain-containing protein, partial [Clostridia bacterium]